MHIPPFSDHPIFSSLITDTVKGFMGELLVNTDIRHFAYVKGTIDGSVNMLFSDAGLSLDWLRQGYPLSIGYSPEHKSFQTFSYFWEECFPPNLMSLARDKHHLYNGISIIRRYRNYYEMFAFGDANVCNMKSTYISCLDDLNNFADYFLKLARDLINQTSQPPFTFSPDVSIQYHDQICLGSNKLQFQAKGLLGDIILSSLEFFSLQLYVGGKSYKEIGKVLSISDKAVEKHLRNIKNKLGYHPGNILFLHEREGVLKLILKEGKAVS